LPLRPVNPSAASLASPQGGSVRERGESVGRKNGRERREICQRGGVCRKEEGGGLSDERRRGGLSGLKGGGGREVCRKEGNTQQSVRKVDAEAKLFHTIIAVHDSRVDSGKVTKAFGKSHDRAVQKL